MEGTTGPNKLTYFVIKSDDMGRAYQLPDVTENQLIVARQLKKFFTGDLNAPVSGYPPFEGTEANFLRAQIAHISADTLVAPAGYFKAPEEPDEENPNQVESALAAAGDDEPKPDPIAFDGLTSLDSWSHFEVAISSMGRMQPPPKLEDGETPDPYYGEEEALRDPLQGLGEDVDGETPNWKVKQSPSFGGPGSVSVVESLQWPGAVAVAAAGTHNFVNCYIGYGVAYSKTTYTPPALPALQGEFAGEFVEQADIVEEPIAPVGDEEEED